MLTTVKLGEALLCEAKKYGKVYSRSVPKQIEHWAKIGKIAEENPDLSYAFIQDILLADAEETVPYEFGNRA
jgi:hypothetical protein